MDAVAIADDVTFVGPTDGQAVVHATAAFRDRCALLGLQFVGRKGKFLNFGNATLHPDTTTFCANERVRILTRGTVLLGTPMGSDRDLVQRLASRELERIGNLRFFDSLRHPLLANDVGDHMLRMAGLPKANFLTRVGFPGEFSAALSSFDQRVASAWQHGLRIEPDVASAESRALMEAPLRHGGLGFTPMLAVSPFAFWGAMANAAYALDRHYHEGLPPLFDAAVTATLAILHRGVEARVAERLLPAIDSTSAQILEFYAAPGSRYRAEHLQRNLRHNATKLRAAAHLRTLPPRQAAALLAARAPWASLPHTLPLRDAQIGNAARAQAACMRAQIPPAEHMPERCHCGVDLGNDPFHPLTHSSGSSEGISGHNAIARVLAREIEKAGGKAWLEPRFQLSHTDDEHTDVRFSLGAVVGYVDVSVVHPTCDTYRHRACQGSLRAAAAVERSKCRQYEARATAEHALFFPFIVETYGGWGKKARELVKLVAEHAIDCSPLWSVADVRRGIQKGVSEQLQLRNLRLLTAQLNLCHRAPPSRPVPAQRRRRRTPPLLSPGQRSDSRAPPRPVPRRRRRQALPDDQSSGLSTTQQQVALHTHSTLPSVVSAQTIAPVRPTVPLGDALSPAPSGGSIRHTSPQSTDHCSVSGSTPLSSSAPTFTPSREPRGAWSRRRTVSEAGQITVAYDTLSLPADPGDVDTADGASDAEMSAAPVEAPAPAVEGPVIAHILD